MLNRQINSRVDRDYLEAGKITEEQIGQESCWFSSLTAEPFVQHITGVFPKYRI